MKSIVSFITLSCALLLVASCDVDFLYEPEQFVPPKFSVPLASRDAVKNFLGVSDYNFKLAFTRASDQALYVIDFRRLEADPASGEERPAVIRLNRDPKRPGCNFDSPLFSPDGALVTYFLRSGATNQAPYVQQIGGQAVAIELAAQGTDPHFWQDSAGALFAVYSDKYMVESDKLSSLAGFATYRQKIDPSTGAPIGGRGVLLDKPFNGGLSRSGRYLCTGYADGAIYDLEEKRLYRVNYSGADGMQICNPSISPSQDTALQGAMLFLPFAGVQKLLYAAGLAPLASIALHEYLIVADKSNTARWYLRRPGGHTEWQDPEWTNHEGFVVALAKITGDDSDARHDCFLIRRSDNALLKLTEGEFKMDNTATPSFWISR